jgi:DNA-binding PadR family transcriptional regulator
MARWRSQEEDAPPNSGGPSSDDVLRPQEHEISRSDSADDTKRQGEGRSPAPSLPEPRKPYRDRDRTYMLRTSEIRVMAETGKFRALDRKDIEEFLYRGEKGQMDADLSSLRRQHLILDREIPQREGLPRQLVALTKEGRHLLLATKSVREGQALYHGFTKVREADHDADLYRLYQRGFEKAQNDGAKNIRVVLDSELKRILYRDLSQADDQCSELSKSAVAERHGLRVVRDTIPVPDLRIEYEKEDGEPVRLDLELATEHYRFRNIVRKIQAGFAIYARSQESQNLRRVLDQRELTAEIFNL